MGGWEMYNPAIFRGVKGQKVYPDGKNLVVEFQDPKQGPTVRYQLKKVGLKCGPFEDKAVAELVASDTFKRCGIPVQVLEGKPLEWFVVYMFRFPFLDTDKDLTLA
jgi:hypothetical protein